MDPVVAAAVGGLGILVGQHKTADQRYRVATAKGVIVLRDAGYLLDPSTLHTQPSGTAGGPAMQRSFGTSPPASTKADAFRA